MIVLTCFACAYLLNSCHLLMLHISKPTKYNKSKIVQTVTYFLFLRLEYNFPSFCFFNAGKVALQISLPIVIFITVSYKIAPCRSLNIWIQSLCSSVLWLQSFECSHTCCTLGLIIFLTDGIQSFSIIMNLIHNHIKWSVVSRKFDLFNTQMHLFFDQFSYHP